MNNPFDPGYYTESDLRDAGFRKLGKNVRIARNCVIIGQNRIEIGSNVRIDGYTSIITAGAGFLELGSFVHIGSYCYLATGAGIIMRDFSGLSQGVRIYSRSDDYTGGHLTNPTVPDKYTGISQGTVTLQKHVIIGSQTVILPGVEIGEGSSVGALSLVTKSLDSWGVYFGIPVKRLKARSRTLLEMEKQFLSELAQSDG